MNRTLTLTALALLLGACTSGMRVNWDYGPDSAEITRGYKSFNWFPPPEDAPNPDKFTLDRIKSSVARELGKKGYYQVTSNPDFWIASYVMADTKVQAGGGRASYGFGWSTYGGAAFGVSYSNRGGASYYEQGTLMFDVIDDESNELVWRGIASAELRPSSTPEQAQRKIDEAVKKIFSRFPPKP